VRPRGLPRLSRRVQQPADIQQTPARLAERVQQLVELQREVPGFDLMRIFKAQ